VRARLPADVRSPFSGSVPRGTKSTVSSGVSLFALGALALAARSFHRRGERRLAVIAKVTAKIVPDAPLAIVAPRPIVPGERYVNGPVSSVVHPGDIALRMPRAQVLVIGAAYAQRGEPASTSTVRLAVARGESMLIDKRLEVVGDRRGPARPSGLGGAQLVEAAAPFVRMPAVYERAFGGHGFARNPVGTGAHAGDDGQAALPNFHHANGRIAQDPAGFGPISSLWPARREMLGATSRQVADRDLDAQLESDFPDAYFVAAPSDQQLDAWLGGEMIALFQMHPTLSALRMHVPRWFVSALLQTARGVRVPVPMKLDTILVEPDAMAAELTFRGDIRVDDEALKGARVGATIAGEKVEVPDLDGRGPGAPAEAFALGDAGGQAAPAPQRRSRDATLVLEEPAAGEAEPARATPFEPPRRARAGTMVMESSPPSAGAPASTPPPPGPAEPRARARAHAGTMILEAEPTPAPVRPLATPPPPAPPAPPPDADDEEEAPATQVMGAEKPRRDRAATMTLDLDGPSPTSLPFDRRFRSDRPEAARGPLPGAPWSPGDFKRPKPTRPGLDETITDEETAVDDAPVRPPIAPPAAPPVVEAAAPSPDPAVPPPPRSPEDAKPRPLWREDPPEAPAPAALPKAPRARVSFKSDLYKKIKK
jgi:hypothetical protein